jgi:hypothetical protein
MKLRITRHTDYLINSCYFMAQNTVPLHILKVDVQINHNCSIKYINPNKYYYPFWKVSYLLKQQ